MSEEAVTLLHEKVFHWGYVVPNIDRAIKTWTRTGSTVIVSPEVDPIQRVSCALLLFESAILIELVAPISEDSPVKQRLARGGGLDHVCFFADDVAASLSNLNARGAVTVVSPCYGAVFDRELAFAMTRGGLLVELMSCKALGRQANDPLSRLPSRKSA